MQNIRRAVYVNHLLHNKDLKATNKRTAVLTIFQQMRTTICAEDIRLAFSKISQVQISTASLYRILKTLEEKNLIKKSNPPDDYVTPLNKRDRTFYVLK